MKKKNITKNKKVENQAPDQLPKENKPTADKQDLDKPESVKEIEKDLNAKILKITMRIKDHYPELSQYLDEMPVTVPSENDPEITLSHLRLYYESLNSLLNKYKADDSKTEE